MAEQLLVKRLSGLYLGEEFSQTSGIISGMGNKKSALELKVNIETVSGDAQAILTITVD